MKPLKYSIKHISKYKIPFFIVFLTVILSQIFSTYTQVRFSEFVDALASEDTTMEILTSIIISFAIIDFGAWISYRTSEVFGNRYIVKVMANMGREAYDTLHHHSYEFFINNFSGALVKKISRYTDGFNAVAENIFFDIVNIASRIIMSLLVMYFTNSTMFMITLVWVVLFLFFIVIIAAYKYKLDTIANIASSKMSGYHADAITNQFNISLFASLLFENTIFSRLLEDWRKKTTKARVVTDLISGDQALLMIGLNLLFLYIGAKFWADKTLDVGDIVLIQTMLWAIFGHLWGLGRILRKIAKGMSDMTEMIEILETPQDIIDEFSNTKLEVKNGEINIKDLDFSYNEKNKVFENFNLTIAPDKKIALVSKSGEGKSTLVKLLVRFYNIPEKSIFIDGQDIMKVSIDSLRRSISLVPQEPVLFHRTLAENIAYAKPNSSIEEIIEAAKKAHCHDFISKLEKGYDTFVGERGVKLSGGERQRVAIARAFIEDAPILILDEATSSLDSESEHYIQEALKELMKGKTVIVIAHRLSTIRMMDEIIVLKDGQIFERGTHEELIGKDKSLYKNFWNIQAGGFEG